MIFIDVNTNARNQAKAALKPGQKAMEYSSTTFLSEAVYKACSDFYDAVPADSTITKDERLGAIAHELVKIGFFRQHDFWPEPKKAALHEIYISVLMKRTQRL